MVVAGPPWCLEFRPTKEEFSQPFCKYVSKVLKEHPDVAMFKVIPPPGWSPRKKPFPKLSSTDISCPIRQHVFGTRGAYRCVLIEQKPMDAATYRNKTDKEGAPPNNQQRNKGDDLKERAFWSSITINPPVYGADTPQSFFDEKLPYGWNLRSLGGCLLKKYGVPDIPGVTTPMTYFGTWKSFFSWHVEDADLFSINYLHFGAPKVWYCVCPSQRAKFERMAQSLFPELHRACSSFLRHKDILLSPSMLRTYGVEYVQARQEPNQFIVLNARAYHSGYNMGFNCAEAVNFATEEWLDIGRSVKRCKCDALKDGVRISMRTFGLSDSESDDESDGESDDESDDGSDEESGAEEEEEEEEEQEAAVGNKRRRASGTTSDARKRRAGSADASPSKRPGAASGARRSGTGSAAAPASPKGRSTKTAAAAAAAARAARSTNTSAEARAKLAAAGGIAKRGRPAIARSGGRSSDSSTRTPVNRAINGTAATASSASKPSGAKGTGAKGSGKGSGSSFRDGRGSAAGRGRGESNGSGGGAAGAGASKAALSKAGHKQVPVGKAAEGPSGEAPKVIIGEDGKGRRHFYMVQVLPDIQAAEAGHLVMRWLKEDKDGLFRPSSDTWEEKSAALVDVRTQWIKGTAHKAGGYRLLTLRSRVMDCDLVD